MNKTHFSRWEEQDQKRREENANEERVQEWLRAQAGVPSTKTDSKEASPGNAPRTNTQVQTSQPTTRQETPAITKTSTRSSRVIKPSDSQETSDEDEAIY